MFATFLERKCVLNNAEKIVENKQILWNILKNTEKMELGEGWSF